MTYRLPRILSEEVSVHLRCPACDALITLEVPAAGFFPCPTCGRVSEYKTRYNYALIEEEIESIYDLPVAKKEKK